MCQKLQINFFISGPSTMRRGEKKSRTSTVPKSRLWMVWHLKMKLATTVYRFGSVLSIRIKLNIVEFFSFNQDGLKCLMFNFWLWKGLVQLLQFNCWVGFVWNRGLIRTRTPSASLRKLFLLHIPNILCISRFKLWLQLYGSIWCKSKTGLSIDVRRIHGS